MDRIDKLFKMRRNHASDEELKEILAELSEEEWHEVVLEIPKTPYLGHLGDLRREGLAEKAAALNKKAD